MRPLFRMWQETLAGFAPICRLPKDDCGTPRRPILCEPAGHTRIRTATSRVGRHAGNVFRISVPFPPGESATSLNSCFYLKEFDCQAVVSHEEEDPDRRSETEIRVRGLKADRSAVQTPQGGSRAWKIPATGGRRHIVVWQTTNPLISKNPAPGLRGFRRCRERVRPRGGPCRSAGKPAAPAPTDSCRPHVSRNTVCGGSKRMRTLPFIRSAASGRSDRTSEREDFAVLISTRNPAGCKSRKNAKGRSSDSFRFRAFPALRPVAKIAEPLAPRGAGTHSNGYCRRFSLHSLFIPTSARPGGCVAETFATQR